MPLITLNTKIYAPINICFDLSRSIDFHSRSASTTNEKAVSGRINGLIELDETVTWEATHFWIKQKLTSKITALEKYSYFRDEMVNGAFAKIYHEHIYEQNDEFTIMIDKFEYEAPFSILGKLFDVVILNNYMKNFLIVRNSQIKKVAENGEWINYLKK
ncbi:MAG: SRPBCC family protein [Chlorobiota bacterium]|nr:SRPBCC family protein [Chlorobiota bacterium]QQS67299.1 MAG: SRPBCC family protein [Chlorobiota bacterium]